MKIANCQLSDEAFDSKKNRRFHAKMWKIQKIYYAAIDTRCEPVTWPWVIDVHSCTLSMIAVVVAALRSIKDLTLQGQQGSNPIERASFFRDMTLVDNEKKERVRAQTLPPTFASMLYWTNSSIV